MITDGALNQLRSAVRGTVITPGDARYETTRRVFNAMIDRRPAIIIRCTCPDDVATSVRFAREQDLRLSVRGGGHSVAGSAVRDGAVMIDLELMKSIHVDPIARTARAEPGLRLGEFDAATQAHGLATPMGIASDTGIAGLTLGGGLGWLNGVHGLACDNVRSFDVVTADGQRLVADVNREPDLYWALRGGSGNFGVVTSFEYQLHAVGPTVLGGMIVFPFSRAIEVIEACFELSESGPDELSTISAILSLPDGTPAVAVAICHCGSIEDGTAAVAKLRRLGSPLLDAIQPMPYVKQQSLLDDAFPPKVNFHYWKSGFSGRMSADGLRELAEQMTRKPSPLTLAYFQQLHGAAARVPSAATAFPHRGYRYDFAFIAQWTAVADTDANVRWIRQAFQAMEPYLEQSVYVNNLGEEGPDRVRAAYGPNYSRLAAVKTRYDPGNVFQSTQNVVPQAAGV